MDIREVLRTHNALIVRGELTLEKAQIAQTVWDAGVSLISVGLAAAKAFGRDIPDHIGTGIKTAIEDLHGAMAHYLDDGVDATAVRAAIRDAQGRAAELHESLRNSNESGGTGHLET